MVGNIAVQVVLLAVGAGPEVDATQFAQFVKERSGPLKSVIFVYEGGTRWVGPSHLGMTAEKFDDNFQGNYLYRADGAAVMDVYVKKVNPTASVVRRKKSVLNGKTETVRGILDAKSPFDPAHDVRFGENGSVAYLNDSDSPQNLFWTWYWFEWGDLSRRNYTFQGWEEVDGHNCLRFQLDTHGNGRLRDRDYQRFWVDVERNAHVVKMETYTGGKLATKIDISLYELPGPGGKNVWFPGRGHTKWYVWGTSIYTDPVSERTIDLVAGSLRINVDLPDSLFTVLRATALPSAGELEKLKAASGPGTLRREFEAQPSRKPFRTDPSSVRERIDENLAEADRQSKELEASSPARASWSWPTFLQFGFALLGVGLLTAVTYRKWNAR